MLVVCHFENVYAGVDNNLFFYYLLYKKNDNNVMGAILHARIIEFIIDFIRRPSQYSMAVNHSIISSLRRLFDTQGDLFTIS